MAAETPKLATTVAAPIAPRPSSIAPGVAAPRASSIAPVAGPSTANLEPTLLTPEVWFDQKDEEEFAMKEAQLKLEIRALPVRQYLESSVVPLLLSGLQMLSIERPENPIDYLAKYLIEKNPMKPPPKIEEKIAEVSPEAPKKEEKQAEGNNEEEKTSS